MTIQFVPASGFGVIPSVWSYDTLDIGAKSIGNRDVFVRERLSTEPVGSTTLTLTNVVVGSRYRVEVAGSGAVADPPANAEGVAALSTVALTLSYYAPGNSNNDVRIKVRKGTSPTRYKPYETQATLGAAAQSVYIAQVADE